DRQPMDLPSAGSTFKRPEGAFAAELIDRCGLKGFRIGGAEVSEKHAGFVVNRGGATCREVLELIDYVKKTVREQTGFLLEPEVKFLGF
ncbi:MAG TPA: UDP-N-acetylenolpyruvoylglucosamine reductase, partial [Oscillospiraceae bacterium]|nr:UDP-N-acetylenolpyruvoylglucosamine reductase [Oscillospiraceae bacterium]